jgi:hypothetical protein
LEGFCPFFGAAKLQHLTDIHNYKLKKLINIGPGGVNNVGGSGVAAFFRGRGHFFRVFACRMKKSLYLCKQIGTRVTAP